MQFPLRLTWAELADLPGAADQFGWDKSCIDEDDPDTTLEGVIATYSEAFTSSRKLTEYLRMIGYELTVCEAPDGAVPATFTGIRVRSEVALQTAHALFTQICHEYDDPDCPTVVTYRAGGDWHTTPTWALFELGGDDDVDYCGTQPSCLTALLIDAVEAHRD